MGVCAAGGLWSGYGWPDGEGFTCEECGSSYAVWQPRWGLWGCRSACWRAIIAKRRKRGLYDRQDCLMEGPRKPKPRVRLDL